MMSRLAALAALALSASPALAHSGVHLHPHGAETWIALTVVAVIAAGCASLVWSRK